MFSMVALLQNSQTRAEAAVQRRLSAIADGMANLLKALADGTRAVPYSPRSRVGLKVGPYATDRGRSRAGAGCRGNGGGVSALRP